MTKNTDTRYTVFHPETGDVHGRGLSVLAAAKAKLDSVDPTFDVIADQDIPGAWHLLRSEPCQSSGFQNREQWEIAYFEYAETREQAWDLFAAMVVADAWSNAGRRVGLEAMTDQRYDEYVREGKE